MKKKILAVLLAAAMILNTHGLLFASQSAESAVSEMTTDGQEVTETPETVESMETGTVQTETPQENEDSEESTAGEKETDPAPEEQEVTPTPAENSVQAASVPSAAEEETEEPEPQTGGWDSTQPVIEEVIFEQKGQVLSVGDELKVQVRAYDLDTGIKEIRVDYEFEYLDAGFERVSDVPMHLTEEGDLYESDPYVISKAFSYGYITRIRVVDNAGNFIDADVTDPQDGRIYRYSFKGDQEESGSGEPEEPTEETFTITDVRFEYQGKTVERGTTCDISIALDKDYEEGLLNCWAITPAGKDYFGVGMSKDDSDGRYHTLMTLPTEVSGIWKLNFRGTNQTTGKDDVFVYEGEELWYNVDEIIDENEPKITGVELDRQGQRVKPGETVSVKIYVDMVQPLENTIWVNFENEDVNNTV